MRQIGFFGGTFDPVHNGHMAVARAAIEQLYLDELLFIPAASPPHKSDQHITPFSGRVAMLELALADEERFSVSTIEAERGGPSYTIDTLTLFRKRLGPDASFYFIIGLDAFAEITTWKKYRKLLADYNFVVIDRRSHFKSGVKEVVMRFFGEYQQVKEGVRQSQEGSRIYSLSMEPVQVSSSMIRERLGQKQGISGIVPQGVGKYIYANGLYGSG